MLKLKTVTIPSFTYRFEFPDEVQELGDGSERVFIEVDGRAGGNINTALMAGAEDLAIRAVVFDKQREVMQKDADKDVMAAELLVKHATKSKTQINLAQYSLIYDTCVTAWRTNILDAESGEHIPCNRETFLELTEVKLPGFADFFDGLVAQVGEAADTINEADKETEKN